ncbi:MAG: winged helix-turn-helix domain-containing protein [Dermatophilaceae bacterium]
MSHPEASTRYGHVASVLRGHIREGRYPVGTELPSIASIAKDFDVSHMTAKQALKLLREQGVITTGRGVRARVAAVPSKEPAPIAVQLEAIHDRLDSLETRTRALELHATKPNTHDGALP